MGVLPVAEATALETAMETGVTSIKTTADGIIMKVLPVALAITGTFVAIKLGLKIFHKVTGR